VGDILQVQDLRGTQQAAPVAVRGGVANSLQSPAVMVYRIDDGSEMRQVGIIIKRLITGTVTVLRAEQVDVTSNVQPLISQWVENK